MEKVQYHLILQSPEVMKHGLLEVYGRYASKILERAAAARRGGRVKSYEWPSGLRIDYTLPVWYYPIDATLSTSLLIILRVRPLSSSCKTSIKYSISRARATVESFWDLFFWDACLRTWGCLWWYSIEGGLRRPVTVSARAQLYWSSKCSSYF